MFDIDVPRELKRLIESMRYEENSIGYSNARVFHLFDDDKNYYLKIRNSGDGLRREYEVINWLKNMLSVPEVLFYADTGENEYMLSKKIRGEMACSAMYLSKPEETVKMLAFGISAIRTVKARDCPFDIRLNNLLDKIKTKIDTDGSQCENHAKDDGFASDLELYEYLLRNKPAEPDIAFSHGDYCLPNIMLDANAVSGYLDFEYAGVADIYQDISSCIWSMEYNFKTDKYNELLFEHLGIPPDWDRVKYYHLLDKLT